MKDSELVGSPACAWA